MTTIVSLINLVCVVFQFLLYMYTSYQNLCVFMSL